MPPVLGLRDLPAWRCGHASRGAAPGPYDPTVLLMQGALQRIGQARASLGRCAHATAARQLAAAIAIIDVLRAGLDLQCAWDANWDDLYDYLVRQLRRVDSLDAHGTLNEVCHLLEEMRAAWFLVVPRPWVGLGPDTAVQ